MFSGTLFARGREPDSNVQLSRTCWAFYDRVDGATPVAAIADALQLSEAETFAAIQQLRAHDLIRETTLTYDAYRAERGDAPALDTSSRDEPSRDTSSRDGSSRDGQPGDGQDDAYELDLSTQELEQRTLHVPSLWSWLQSTADNVKDYKNIQAFVLMEASDALSGIGVESLDDLERLERCDDPAVIRAFEEAVANNANERIPDQCYQ
jgi:DNA-binding Lrp family transcriptional regulator